MVARFAFRVYLPIYAVQVVDSKFEYLTHSLALRLKLVHICNMALEAPQVLEYRDKAFQFLRGTVTGVITTALASHTIKDRHGIVYKVNLRCDNAGNLLKFLLACI